MNEIPSDIDIEKLPGPVRGKYPALYFRDEVSWSPSGRRFALAYTIAEASYGNEIGCLLWAESANGHSQVLGTLHTVHACCWRSPWCSWLDDETFVFKAQSYTEGQLFTPVVAINVRGRFAVIPSTQAATVWHDQVTGYDGPWSRLEVGALRTALKLP